MSAPLPVTLTPRAKSIVAAVAATVLAGITAWQTVTRSGFTWVDVLPVVVAVLGAIQTDLIPNVPDQPVAKAIVSGLAAVTAAVATVVAADPSGLTVAKIGTVAAGAFLVYFIPEAAPAVRVIEGEVAAGAKPAAVAATVAADVSTSMGPDLDLSATQPFPAVTASEPTPPAVPTAPRIPAA